MRTMKRAQQSNVLLDEQAKQDAQVIARYFNLGGTSAAIRYALREVARQVESDREKNPTPDPTPDENTKRGVSSDKPRSGA